MTRIKIDETTQGAVEDILEHSAEIKKTEGGILIAQEKKSLFQRLGESRLLRGLAAGLALATGAGLIYGTSQEVYAEEATPRILPQNLGLSLESTTNWSKYPGGLKEGEETLSQRLLFCSELSLSPFTISSAIGIRGQAGDPFHSSEPYKDGKEISLDRLWVTYTNEGLTLRIGKFPDPLKTKFTRDPEISKEGFALEYTIKNIGGIDTLALSAAHYLNHDINNAPSAQLSAAEVAVKKSFDPLTLAGALSYNHVHDVTGPLKANFPDAEFRYVNALLKASLDLDFYILDNISVCGSGTYNFGENEENTARGGVVSVGLLDGLLCVSGHYYDRGSNPFPYATFQDVAGPRTEGYGATLGLNLLKLFPGLKEVKILGGTLDSFTLGAETWSHRPYSGGEVQRSALTLGGRIGWGGH